MKQGLYIAASMIALLAAAPAQAQEPGAVEAAGEIVVTAQKRVQNVQDVPISIAVVNGEELQQQGSASLVDYAGYVPGMNVSNGGTPGQTTITLRGVAPLNASQTVGIYLDDAPVGSSAIYNRAGAFTIDLMPYDLERIEVLKGPQGTLYGASSIGGLVKYVTVQPNTNAFSVKAGVEGFAIKGGDGLGWGAQVMVNVPLIQDRLAVSGSFAWRSTPGWVDSVNNAALKDQNDYEQRGGRAALLWTPTPEFSVKLAGIWQSLDSEGNALYAADLTGVRLGDGRSYNNFVPESFDVDLDYYSATLDYDFGSATLTSATTYSKTKSAQVQDASYAFGVLFPLLTGGAVPPGITPFLLDLGLKKWTQEVRLASPSGGRFEWLIGGFFTDETTSNSQLVRSFDMAGNPIAGLDPLAIVGLPATYKEYAIFGNGTFKLSDQFEITGGLRWARNKQTFRQISSGAIVPQADDPGKSAESVFTYSISPQFHINEDAMLYARLATGYRPGGPNVIVPNVPPTVDADRMKNYEVGLKADFADRMVSVDVAIFLMDWTDIQVVRSFGGVSGGANGGKARSKGIEGSLALRPTPGLTISATGSYTDAVLSEDVPDISGVKGDRLPAVPKFSGALRADYEFELGGGNKGSFGAGIRHASNRLSLVESDPLVATAKPYTSVDLNASITFNDHWTLRAYARNLLDNQGEMARSTFANGLNQPSFLGISPLQPRTVGVALDMAF
ncbi:MULTISPECIES: TonB-dependent receptor [unclassified Sphingopyxis]|uniref:TonB-dependent receptor n=1 Tax=unclassified Sphingopyxis TaxID=2614943 RepID=UPI0028665061|nr:MULTISPECIES: TonB-dependent receptor [unclassified Sphingopyxis]MDR6834887.1 outer membrane receptor protein involved in Fe transport [Sphingopyxis sp. BE122]MDR7227158.1 outer membrane receptor protein involved in Fe transport [Sphingopyxis sp. BE259]